MAWLKIRGMSKVLKNLRGRRRAFLELDGLLKRRPREFPAVSGSAWQWGARSSASRQSSYSTNPPSNLDAKLRVQMRLSYNICIVVFVPPRSMLLTIR